MKKTLAMFALLIGAGYLAYLTSDHHDIKRMAGMCAMTNWWTHMVDPDPDKPPPFTPEFIAGLHAKMPSIETVNAWKAEDEVTSRAFGLAGKRLSTDP